MKMKRITILGICVSILVILLLVLVLISNTSKNKKLENDAVLIKTTSSVDKKVNKAMDEAVKEKLSKLSEQKRVEYYATDFIKAIEARNISKAYSVLNLDFKTNYFNTKKSFEDYVDEYFPKEMSTKYENMERLGDIYVLVVDIKDILSKDPNDFECYIVVKENDYNDYELSFSVDSAMKKYSEEE